MRSRNLKPGFFKNDLLAECDPLARILFTGLWCMADREGRMEYRPKKMKAELLPYDDCNVIHLLYQLQMKGFIIVYNHDGVDYLEIPTFLNHQNPHVKELESTIPAPDENSSYIVLARLIPDSLLLIPDSLNPQIDSLKPARASTVRRPFRKELFERFWNEYPKKKAKQDAVKAFTKLNPDEPMMEIMLSSLELAKTSGDWLKEGGQYIPLPATWLNGKRWEDEHTSSVQSHQEDEPDLYKEMFRKIHGKVE